MFFPVESPKSCEEKPLHINELLLCIRESVDAFLFTVTTGFPASSQACRNCIGIEEEIWLKRAMK
jgi:hypothetical protein